MRYTVVLFFLLFLASCGEGVLVPKSRSYPKIEFPGHTYKPFDATYCAFTFQQPAYMEVVQDTTRVGFRRVSDCWFNLSMKYFNGDIHCTYTPLINKDDLFKVYNDAYKMVSDHNKKSGGTFDYKFENKNEHVYGILYELEGSVASSFQFIVTDSSKHALRGALYFNARPEPDSIKPVLEFVKIDIMNMLNTLHWNN